MVSSNHEPADEATVANISEDLVSIQLDSPVVTATPEEKAADVTWFDTGLPLPIEIVEKIMDHLPRTDLLTCLTVNRGFNLVACVRLYQFLDVFKHGANPVLDKRRSKLLKMTNTLRVFPHSEDACKHIPWADLKYLLFPGQTVVHYNEDELEWYRLGVVKPAPNTPPSLEAVRDMFNGLVTRFRTIFNDFTGSAPAPPSNDQHHNATEQEQDPYANVHVCGAIRELHTDTVIYRPRHLATSDSRPHFTLNMAAVNNGPNCHQVFQVILPHQIPSSLIDDPSQNPFKMFTPHGFCPPQAPHTIAWIFWTPGPVATPHFQDHPVQAAFWLYELPVLLALTSPTAHLIIVNADAIYQHPNPHCECPHWCHGALEFLERSGLLSLWNKLRKEVEYLSMPELLEMMPQQPFLTREEVTGWHEAMQKVNKGKGKGKEQKKVNKRKGKEQKKVNKRKGKEQKKGHCDGDNDHGHDDHAHHHGHCGHEYGTHAHHDGNHVLHNAHHGHGQQ